MLANFTLGSGPKKTVLLHGFLGSGRNLRSLAQRWLERDPSRTMLLPDLTGHGDSPALPDDATLETLARDVLATTRAAGWTGPLELVGHSLGGRVAIACLAVEPAAVSRIVLLDISPGAIDPTKSESGAVLDKLLSAPETSADRGTVRSALTAAGLSLPIAEWLLTNLVERDGRYVWRMDREALKRFHASALGADLWERVEPAPIPMLCVRGGRSAYVSDGAAARMASAGIAVETLPTAGHYVHVDTLNELLALL